MFKRNSQKIFLYLSSFIIIELLSYLSLVSVSLNQLVFTLLIIGFACACTYSLEIGLLFVAAELFIGSMGHLFTIALFGQVLSIRIAFWLVIMTVFSIKFIWQLIKQGKKSEYLSALKKFPALKYFLILLTFVLVSLANAYLHQHPFNLIFSDANSWLYFSLIFPLVVVYDKNYSSVFKNLKDLFIASAIWISIKTLVLLFIFTHDLSFASEVYLWLRKTLVGEMTPTLSGWPRIFIQGQIYSGLALFFSFWSYLKFKPEDYSKRLVNLLLAMLFASSLLISFSRSFWVGLICSFVFSLIIVWRVYNWKRIFISTLWFISSFFLGFVLIYLVAIFPFPKPGSFNADFISRVSNGNESAVSSRWSLLPVLGKEIAKEPFFGQGYGATITYISSDPRVLEKDPSGTYTTYAFEWGYFDVWLKLGLFGLLSYLWLLFYLVKNSIIFSIKNANYVLLGLSSGIIFLAATNFFTPYLNHPLGIGILLFGSCLIQRDRVY